MSEKKMCTGSGKTVELNNHEATFRYASCCDCNRENLKVDPKQGMYDEVTDFKPEWVAVLPQHAIVRGR